MKKNKRIALLLATTMALSTLVACGSDSGSGGSIIGGGSSSSAAKGGGTDNGDGTIGYTFHYHARDQYVFNDQWPVFQEMEDLFGIRLINTGNPVATNSEEQIQMQAIDRFPSDLYGGNNTGPYYMLYGPQGAFYAIGAVNADGSLNYDEANYWDSVPNFVAYLEENPDVAATIVAEDGFIYHIPYIAEGGVARTYHIRQDWLDNLGLDVPETVADFEKVLIAFRDDDPNGNGVNDEIPYFNDKWNEMIRLVNLWDARCYSTDTYSERVVPGWDGVMYHAWMTDEFREGITNISRWYDEGLIDKSVFTKGNSSRKEYLPGDTGGVTHEWVASTSSYNDTVDIEGFNLVTMAPPITATGNQWEEHQRIKVKPDGWAISSNCPSSAVPALFEYMDYMYSEEGRILSNFGVEGEQYEMVDGEPQFLPGVLDGSLTTSKAVNAYLEEDVGAQLKHGYWQDYRYEWQWTNEIGQTGVQMYTDADYASNVVIMPTLNYTTDELKVYESLITDMNSYLDEIVQTWVIGSSTAITDDVWAAHLKRMSDLGVDELVANYQQAYDRHMAMMS